MTVFKREVLICCILFSVAFTSSGQDTLNFKAKVLFDLKDLHELKISELSSLVGEYTLSKGFGGCTYTFDSDGSFKKRDFSCLDNHVSDSGVYRLKQKGQLELISKRTKNKFVVYRFDKFLFLIPPSKSEVFKREFLSYADQYYNIEPVKMEDDRYTDQFFIAFNLMKNHLTKLE